MDTSRLPLAIPSRASAPSSAGSDPASAGNGKVTQNSARVRRVSLRLPKRTSSAPANGMATTAPSAMPSRATPNAPVDRPTSSLTAGMRAAQFAKPSPLARNARLTARRAWRSGRVTGSWVAAIPTKVAAAAAAGSGPAAAGSPSRRRCGVRIESCSTSDRIGPMKHLAPTPHLAGPTGRERGRRFWRDDVLAGAWRWLLVILLLLLIVPLPGPSRLHARSAAYVSKSSAAAAAVRFALDQLGKRYRWGGAGPMAYDCSGLTMMAYRSAGVRIPRVSRWQYEVDQRIPVRQLVAGDLVFYARNPANPSTIDHVGMYLGGGRMVEAANRSVPIRIASIWRPGLMRYGVRPAPSSPRM